jgi:hypothetical protein
MSQRSETKYQEFRMNEYPKIQFNGGTMDKTTYRGCFLEVRGQFKSKTPNHLKTMRTVIHELKLSIEKNMDKDLFKDRFITHEDISVSYKDTGSSFTKLEFTLYPKRQTDKVELQHKLNSICDKIYTDIFEDNELMEFEKRQIKNRA